jgi:hypothetical protein
MMELIILLVIGFLSLVVVGFLWERLAEFLSLPAIQELLRLAGVGFWVILFSGICCVVSLYLVRFLENSL